MRVTGPTSRFFKINYQSKLNLYDFFPLPKSTSSSVRGNVIEINSMSCCNAARGLYALECASSLALVLDRQVCSGVFDQVNFVNLLILNRLMTRRNQFTKLRETDWPGYGETMGEWDC